MTKTEFKKGHVSPEVSPKFNKAEAEALVRYNINERLKKYYSPVTPATKRMDGKSLPEFISELVVVPINDAKSMIESYGVTVDGELVTDITYVLKSGDVVRADVGHFLNNSGFMAVIK